MELGEQTPDCARRPIAFSARAFYRKMLRPVQRLSLDSTSVFANCHVEAHSASILIYMYEDLDSVRRERGALLSIYRVSAEGDDAYWW